MISSATRTLANGICPSCESAGAVGESCVEKVCARQGVCFIPDAMARTALAQGPGNREPLIGQFLGDFLIVGRLGKGGFGKVLCGLQRPLYKLQAAVKLLEFDEGDARTNAKVESKFETEASSLAVLHSPHIVRLLQYGSFHGRPYMAMEFIPGSRTLQTEITRMVVGHESLPAEVIQRIIAQVLLGLEAAHREGIIHRDIKPENIMLQDVVGDPWFVKLVDFGLAKLVAESHETSLVLGTVHYMAPEQVEAKNLGPWTDLYAVGVIAYELLIGHRPFVGKETQVILREKLNPAFDPIARCAHLDLPDVVVSFLRKALHRFPDKRYRSTAEFRAAWSNVFETINVATNMFSMDLSGLVDSAEISELRRIESELLRQRQDIEAQRRALENERRLLESERIRASSSGVKAESRPTRMGDEASSPAAVESWVMGTTQALPSDVSAGKGEPYVPGTASVSPSVLMNSPAPQRASRTRDTRAIGHAEIAVDAVRTKRTPWVPIGAGLVVAAGAVAMILASGTGPEASNSVPPSVVAHARVTNPAADGESPVEASRPAIGDEHLDSRVGAPETPDELAVRHADSVPGDVSEADTTQAPKHRLADGAATTLVLDSKPTGLAVFVDGVRIGNAPQTLATTVGATHRFEVETASQQRVAMDVKVTDSSDAETLLLDATAMIDTVRPAEPKEDIEAVVEPSVQTVPATAQPVKSVVRTPTRSERVPKPRPSASKQPAAAIPDF